ncbi:hypothetical protein J4463_04650 [Candidatus Pacearchaeota archaeon]|nr:hypothetical protein [Candidatus Pacearchaeota archaeon]
MGENKKAQIWVETVIYTLIAISLIAIVLSFAYPAINKQKDRAVVLSTIDAMTELDNNIREIYRFGPGNKRQTLILINNGALTINPSSDSIVFELEESAFEYSEAGRIINVSGTNIAALTEKKGDKFKITLSLNYNNLDIKYNSEQDLRAFTKSQNPYNIMAENKGRGASIPDSKIVIDLYEVSG